MKIFVISLHSSQTRKTQMIKKMKAANVSFEFFNAIDASEKNFKFSEKAAPKTTKKLKGYELIPSEIACYSSHFSLWEKCISLNEPIVILEDNIDVTDEFKSTLDNAFSKIDTYRYIKLSATLENRKFISKENIDKKHQIGFYDKGTCGTTGYILSPIAAKRFIEHSDKFIEPVDNFMEKPWKHGIQTYSVYPSICERANIESTIGSKRKAKGKLSILKKIFIEGFRGYESLMMKIYWKH